MNVKQVMLMAFEGLLIEAFQNTREKEAGICPEIYDFLDARCTESNLQFTDCVDEFEDVLSELFRTWSKFSGSLLYPIPAPWYYWVFRYVDNPSAYFHNSYCRNTLWKGRNLVLRVDLIRHCINSLKTHLAEGV